mmetsp:Transcript_39408/g.85360  ORF Transcript_39408/g.85360 Transcript_39408/m.85360 type:complete len:110 (+) Transcript_39408:551-880(+)
MGQVSLRHSKRCLPSGKRSVSRDWQRMTGSTALVCLATRIIGICRCHRQKNRVTKTPTMTKTTRHNTAPNSKFQALNPEIVTHHIVLQLYAFGLRGCFKALLCTRFVQK